MDFYEPYPKNPKIAKIFKEIGLADELGSGVRNMYKYTKIYSGGLPELKEDDIFRAYIPLTENAKEHAIEYQSDRVNDHVNDHVNDRVNDRVSGYIADKELKIIRLIEENARITHNEMANKLGVSEKTVRRSTQKLKEKGIIRRVGADKNGFWEII